MCLEGVPEHGRHLETVSVLFKSSCLMDCVDDFHSTDHDAACFCIWIWTADPESITRRGALGLEERPRAASPLLNLPELGLHEPPPSFDGPAKALSYPILLHLDKVWDYSPRSPSIDSGASSHSALSGSDDELPRRRSLAWRYAYEDNRNHPSQRAPEAWTASARPFPWQRRSGRRLKSAVPPHAIR